MSERRTAEVPTLPLPRIVGLTLAAALVPLNSTMIAVALPAIADDFEVSTGRVSILITLYLVVMLVGQPTAGRIADRIGSRRTLELSLVGLAAFSAAAAVAPSFPVLVLTRCLQAACAAALGPGVQSLLRTATPPEQHGRVFGILGSVLGVGAASGPVVGGLLVQASGWQAIFAVNVPIALVALTSTRTGATGATDRARGTVTATDPGRIANAVFNASFSAQALSTQAQYALLILTPIVLDARGWGSAPIGLSLAALTVGMIVMGPIGGRIGDAHGRRLPTSAGLGLATVAVAVLAVLGRDVHPAVLVAGLACFGVGLGGSTPNLMSAALGSVPMDRSGTAAGIFSMSRYVGSIVATVSIGVLVTAEADGTSVMLLTSTACMLAATVATRWLPSDGTNRPAATPSVRRADARS